MQIADVHKVMRAYLAGNISWDEFDCWVEDNTWNMHKLDLSQPVADLLGDLSLMTIEMVCSGKMRTEQMFRRDIESILNGQQPTAFWAPRDPQPLYLEGE